MDLSLFITIGSGVFGLFAYFVRVQMQRLDTLEQQIITKMTEEETRQILSDKVDPIKEDMAEIKLKVDKVIDLLINKSNKN